MHAAVDDDDERTNKHLWQDQAKTLGGDALLTFLLEMRDSQRQTVNEMKRFNNAFPGGDADAHRRYHESVIEWRELRNKLVRAALEKAFSAGALGATAWILYGLWQAFRMELKK